MFKKIINKFKFHESNKVQYNDQPRKINPELVHNIAAEIFWNYAYIAGFQEANSCALEEIFPEEMLSYDFVKNISLKYVKEVPDFIVPDIFAAVKEEITSHARMERNLLGPIYIEDIPNGKSLEFNHHDKLKELQNDGDMLAPYRVNISTNNKIETMGELLIRTPLPSVVISSVLPDNGVIFIESTENALGFHKTMVLRLSSAQNLSSGSYILEGIIHLPIGNARSSDLWHKVIPNSVGFYEKTTFNSRDGAALEVSLDFG